MEDIQNSPDTRNISINKVGIKDIKHPIVIKDKNGTRQHSIGNFSMYVNLPVHLKGTHMSRFIEILNQKKLELSVDSFEKILQEVADKLESRDAFVEVSFPFFLNKNAPVSKVKGLMDYAVHFSGACKNGQYQCRVRVDVVATSLCPCSKKISDYGAHNQRSIISVEVEAKSGVWIEDLVRWVEQQASAEVYSILKRPDEKYVTEQAYDNPKFVEDLVRDIAEVLIEHPKIGAFSVEAENFESIHNHSAYAKIENG